MKSALGFVCSLLLFVAVIYGAVSYQLRRTVFSADFADAQIERVDPVRVVRSMLIEQLDATTAAALTPVIDSTLEDQRAWLVAEARQAAQPFQDYLRGDEDRIQVHLDPEPVRKSFLANMESSIRTSMPPAIQRLGESERALFESSARTAANAVFDRIGSFTFDSETLAPDQQLRLAGLRARLARFQRSLILITCAVVALGFLAGLVGELRQAGVAMLLAGVVLLVPTLLARSLVGFLPLPSLDKVPGVIAAYLPAFTEALMAPLTPVAIASVIVGLGMIGLSFVLPKPTADAARTRQPVRGR